MVVFGPLRQGLEPHSALGTPWRTALEPKRQRSDKRRRIERAHFRNTVRHNDRKHQRCDQHVLDVFLSFLTSSEIRFLPVPFTYYVSQLRTYVCTQKLNRYGEKHPPGETTRACEGAEGDGGGAHFCWRCTNSRTIFPCRAAQPWLIARISCTGAATWECSQP